jgi:thiamine-phosphate pyrophosphorylase
MSLTLPRLYAIADRGRFALQAELVAYVQGLLKGGVALLQYRNKTGNAREMLSDARAIREIALRCTQKVTLIMNDRADLCLAAEYDGVHLGQEDMSPEAARRVFGPSRLIGISTHNVEQAKSASESPVDYVAIGPIFGTRSKINPDPDVGLEELKRVREIVRQPLVAIGGITPENAGSVYAAGADSVAVISALETEAALGRFLAAATEGAN